MYGSSLTKRVVIAAVVGLFGVLVMAGGVNAVTTVSSCQVISSPGVYVLNTDILDSSVTACINITSSDVVFDGQGHTIDGVDSASTYGMYIYNSSNVTNVTLKNLIVADWGYGVYYYNASKGTIENVSASSNIDGMQLSYSNNNAVKDCNVSSNRDSGIFLSNSDNNEIADNVFDNHNIKDGIYLYCSDFNTIANNSAGSNGQHGIFTTQSNNNIISNNTAINNTKHGIYVDLTSGNTVSENNASYNGGIGLYCVDCENNSVTENKLNHNNKQGIYIYGTSDNNTITNNTLNFNEYGMEINGLTDSVISVNSISSNKRYGVLTYELDNNTFSNNTMVNNPFGAYIYARYGGGTDSNRFMRNNITGGSYGIVLHDDGCQSNDNHYNITHNNISNSFYGIYLLGSCNTYIFNNTANNNTYYGISVWKYGYSSTLNKIVNNTARNNYFGVYIVESHNNTVTGNILESNYYFGLVNRSSENNTFANNVGVEGNYTINVSGVRIKPLTFLIQSVDNQTKASYEVVIENMGNRQDSINVSLYNPDSATYTFEESTEDLQDWSSSSLPTSFQLDPGSIKVVRLNVSSTDAGMYYTSLNISSFVDPVASDKLESRTIVHGDDHEDSAIVNSNTPGSTIYYSVIENSTITDSNISYSEIYNSEVVNSELANVILNNSYVVNGTITNGTIKKGGVEYNITRNVTISELVSGTDKEDSTLFGMTEANKTLDFNSTSSNLSFRIATASDYIGGSLTVQRSTIEPSDALNQTNNVGGYSWITPSTNVEEGMEWVYMVIYYNESELGNVSEEDLKFQYFNETTQEWEYLNKTFVEDFSSDSAWTNKSGTWNITADGRYNGSSNGTAISVINDANTGSGNTYIQVKMNITNGTTENGLIVFSYTNNSDFYYAGIRNHSLYTVDINSSAYSVYTNSSFNFTIGYFNGTWNDKNFSTEAINQTAEYEIEVFIEGNNVSIFASGEKKSSYIFSSLPAGNLGFGVYNTTNHFDDITVYHPKSGVNTVENYVWGNATHLSVYGMNGAVYGVAGAVYGIQSSIVNTAPVSTITTPTTTSPGGGPSDSDKSTDAKTVTPTDASVVAQLEAKFSSIPKGKTGTISIPETEDVPLTEIAIKVKNKVTSVEVKVKALASKPSDITQSIAGRVLRYLEIDHENIEEDDIDTLTIKFKVEKSWITENNIDADKVVLNRFSEGQWTALTTTKESEDTKNAYYSAESPGLSVFGVSGSIVSAVPATTVAPPVMPATTKPPLTTPPPTAPPATPEPTPLPVAKIATALIAISVIAAAAYLFIIKKGD